MEWVETTGKTLEEALDAALEQLGVAEDEVDYEILDEPKSGLFGRSRGEFRVRARVRPTTPRAKDDRRDRKRRDRKPARASDRTGGASDTTADGAEAQEDADSASDETDGAGRHGAADAGERRNDEEADDGDQEHDAVGAEPDVAAPTTPSAKRAPRRRGGATERSARAVPQESEHDMSETALEVPLAEQGEVAADFLRGLLDTFGLTGTVSIHELDDETVEVAVTGDDLGLFIGPKGATLSAIQDLARTVVQRKTSARQGRLLIEVAGYRQKRKEALERFARSAAEQVRSSQARVVLEPMNASDRKVIHDTVNDLDGVATTSEGEDPRRRVVLFPAD